MSQGPVSPIAVLLAATTAALLAGCAAEPESAPVSKAPAAVAAGEPEKCLSTGQIANTVVHDDRTIDFVMRNGTIYRNTLPFGCSGLGFEGRFGYRTTLSQLCSSDTITVLQTGGGGPTCGLGEFVPVRLTESKLP